MKSKYGARILCAVLCACLLLSLLPMVSYAGKAEDTYTTLEPGQTYEVDDFDSAASKRGRETVVRINQPGTYTITGSNDPVYRSGKFVISADCTLILDNLNFHSRPMLEANGDFYRGGTQGAFEIADNVTVELVL